MSELRKQTITIFDDVYTIVSDEPEEIFSQAVDYIDDLMKTISLKSKISDKKKLAILSSLQVAVRLKKLEAEIAAFKGKEDILVASVDQFLEKTSS